MNLFEFHLNVPQGFSYQYASVGAYDDLAPNRRQAIIWANVGIVYWRIYMHHSASMG